MSPLSPQEELMKSMVDHPAGRCAPHRYRGPHGDDHRVPRHRAPDTTAFDAVGLVLCVAGVLTLIFLAGALGWHALGIPGAVAGLALAAWGTHTIIKKLEKKS